MADDARAVIENFLRQYGLEGLTEEALAWFSDHTMTDDELLYRVRQTPQYQQRFPAMLQLQQSGRAMSENDYLNYERSIREQGAMFGLNQDFFNNKRIAHMLVSDVSVSEAKERMDLAQTAVMNAPDWVKQAGKDMYGLEPEDLLPLYLGTDEPDTLPMVQRKARAIRAYGQGGQQGVGLTAQQSETVAGLSDSAEAVDRGMQQMAQQRSVLERAAGEQDMLGADTGIAATFGGNQQAAERIRRRQKARESAAGAEQGATVTQQGVSGLKAR